MLIGAMRFLLRSAVENARIFTDKLFVVRLAGGVYITGWPLAVWSALSDPQSWLWQGATFQSTPALRGSLVTTAARLGVVLTNIELGGRALKAIETDAGEGGAGWLRTVVVGPDPHPRDAQITAVNSSTLHLRFGMIIPQKALQNR